MNLLEIATFVCNEMGLYDSASLQRAKDFANAEYKMLWDRYPWIDTQATVNVGLSMGVNEIAIPDVIERIMTVRATSQGLPGTGAADTPTYAADSHFLDPVTTTFLIESDPAILERGGFVLYYEEQNDISTGNKTVRVYPTPVLDQALFIVGKGPCPGMKDDVDKAVIRNIDNVLIAYVLADMLKRQRQYAKAEQQRQIAKDLELAAWDLEQKQTNMARRNKNTTVSGNSLREMVDAVCALAGRWTPDMRVMIREFVRRNYLALYDLFLWPEALIAVRVGYNTEQVVLPHYIDKVLGVRGDGNFRLFPAEHTLFLDIMPTIFEESGEPIGFTILTPVGVSNLPVSGPTRLRLASTSGLDITEVFIRGEVLGTGVEQTEVVTLTGQTPVFTTKYYDVPITVAKQVTFGDLTVNPADLPVDVSLEVIPAGERERKHQRIWLHPAPTKSGSVLVFAKRAITPLVTDEDTPIITGAEHTIIAGAAADTFSVIGQPDSAKDYRAQAAASAKALMQRNEDQQAKEPRLVPEIEPYAYCSEGEVWAK